MASVNGPVDGSTAEGVPGHQFAPPAVERPKAAELFFMKSSDKSTCADNVIPHLFRDPIRGPDSE
jgi:hypothetical protein